VLAKRYGERERGCIDYGRQRDISHLVPYTGLVLAKRYGEREREGGERTREVESEREREREKARESEVERGRARDSERNSDREN